MKKLLLLFITAVMMAGCTNSRGNSKTEPQNNLGFRTIVIDHCEYLIKSEFHSQGYSSTEWGYGFMAHKGNCRFCKERREKEIEKIINELKK